MGSIIEVRGLTKEYRIGHMIETHGTFAEALLRRLRKPLHSEGAERKERFLALRDVSFDVEEGGVVGIIGRNGAGKSTLLKVLSRITDPSAGYAKIRGRLASLLEVGTGFHPELTGRENIYLNGAILGMRRAEIRAKFDEIVAFSDIEQFLDTPVKHYSSGMYVRLAFSVAAHLEPEVLVVDEVLAVGDMAFQKKCLGKMGEVSKGGRTVLFVSHNMAAVENLCQRGIMLERGTVVFDGDAKDAVQHYLVTNGGISGASGASISLENAPGRKARYPVLLRKLEMFTNGDTPLRGPLSIGAPLRLKIHFEVPREIDNFTVGVGFNNLFGQRIFTAASNLSKEFRPSAVSGMQIFTCDIPSLQLTQGEYSGFMWFDIGQAKVDAIEDAFQISVIESDYYGTGRAPWNGTCVMPQSWTLQEARTPELAETAGR